MWQEEVRYRRKGAFSIGWYFGKKREKGAKRKTKIPPGLLVIENLILVQAQESSQEIWGPLQEARGSWRYDWREHCTLNRTRLKHPHEPCVSSNLSVLRGCQGQHLMLNKGWDEELHSALWPGAVMVRRLLFVMFFKSHSLPVPNQALWLMREYSEWTGERSNTGCKHHTFLLTEGSLNPDTKNRRPFLLQVSSMWWRLRV